MEIDKFDEESQDSGDEASGVNVIQLVQFDGTYENLPRAFAQENESHSYIQSAIPSIRNSNKYYKQTYRSAWESMPDFKGWLRGVEGEPTRAYCLYCQKTLHAHRLSLLKHTCTLRHQKAAQIHTTRKSKENMIRRSVESASSSALISKVESGLPDELAEAVVEYSEIDDVEQLDEEQDHDDIDEDEEFVTMESMPVQFQKQYMQQVSPMATSKPPISTHVLDTSRGSPASGLQVSLYKLIEGRWTYINEGVTNSEGRFANFLERNDFTVGRYKLHYDVDRLFEARKQDTLYPFIEIVFDCKAVNDHYHIPLLLSPFGYTTYRGT